MPVGLYPSTITIESKTTTGSDALGSPTQTKGALFTGIAASVQANRSTTGASGNHQRARGRLEQPGTFRIYTPVDVSSVPVDAIVTHVQTGDKYQVMQVVNQGNRGKRWRIEASRL